MPLLIPTRRPLLRLPFAIIAVWLIIACGSVAPAPAAWPALTSPPPATAVAPESPTATASVPPATPSATPEPYDSSRNMYRIWAAPGHPTDLTLLAFGDAVQRSDRSQVPVILEAMRLLHPTIAPDAIETIGRITGGDFDFGLREWREMGEWLGRNLESYPPPPDYPEWKVRFLSHIDPAMADLLRPAAADAPANLPVNLVEIMWGGVRVDGIPPLENPPHILPERATWLWPDDRVFGVSVNGEHRAYPLRIMNAHELANDELGGEPISLVY